MAQVKATRSSTADITVRQLCPDKIVEFEIKRVFSFQGNVNNDVADMTS